MSRFLKTLPLVAILTAALAAAPVAGRAVVVRKGRRAANGHSAVKMASSVRRVARSPHRTEQSGR